ncbi:MAG: hypothetical protein Q7S10_01900 [bacterium]|nr:hypothetical protein [bacterium]
MNRLLILVVAFALTGVIGCENHSDSPLGRMERVEKDLAKAASVIEKQSTQTSSRMERIEKSLGGAVSVLENHGGRIEALEGEKKKLDERIQVLEKKNFIERKDVIDEKTGKIKEEFSSAPTRPAEATILPGGLPVKLMPGAEDVKRTMSSEKKVDEKGMQISSLVAPCADRLHVLPDGVEVWLPHDAPGITSAWWWWCRDRRKQYQVHYQDGQGIVRTMYFRR